MVADHFSTPYERINYVWNKRVEQYTCVSAWNKEDSDTLDIPEALSVFTPPLLLTDGELIKQSEYSTYQDMAS